MAPQMNCYCITKTLHTSVVFNHFLECEQDYLVHYKYMLFNLKAGVEEGK